MQIIASSGPAVTVTDAWVGRGPKVELPVLTGEKVLRNSLLIVCGSVFVVPLLWLLEASIDANATRQLQWPAFTLQHFVTATQADKLSALINSVIISLVATAIATIPAILAGYSFSRHHIPLRGAILMLVLFLSGVPINILIIPIYQIFNLLDTLSLIPTGIFLGATSLPFALYIVKNAVDAIPLDLEEQARLEGASLLQILHRIVVPLAMPGIAAAAIFAFVNTWGNFLAPLVLIASPDQQPSPIKIFGFMGADIIRYGDIAAYSLVYSAPVVALYVLSARVFRSGFALGGAIRG